MGMPDSNGVFDIHEQMDSDLIKLVSNVNSYERENVVRLENSVELLLENLQSCLSKIGLSQGAIESYETGSFITGKDTGNLEDSWRSSTNCDGCSMHSVDRRCRNTNSS